MKAGLIRHLSLSGIAESGAFISTIKLPGLVTCPPENSTVRRSNETWNLKPTSDLE
jgi:hypothetical protein